MISTGEAILVGPFIQLDSVVRSGFDGVFGGVFSRWYSWVEIHSQRKKGSARVNMQSLETRWVDPTFEILVETATLLLVIDTVSISKMLRRRPKYLLTMNVLVFVRRRRVEDSKDRGFEAQGERSGLIWVSLACRRPEPVRGDCNRSTCCMENTAARRI